ncbi:hypothetical protein ACHAWT_001990 [Skeletonema menzelii]
MDEAAIPVVAPLVLEEEESAIVSETDAAPSDDEANNWLSSSHIRSQHQNHTSVPSATTVAPASSAQNHDDDDDDNDSVDENEMKESAGPEDFYCSNMDDEDEAYVYKHLRSGREETVHVRRAYQEQQQIQGEEEQLLPSSTTATQTKNPQPNNLLHQARLLKPRTSDAILSCPRCFNVVCMDCQQHERYSNQYRAMFVMNIGVDWTKKMMYDDAIGGLKAYTTNGGNVGRTLGGIMEGDEEEDASMPDRIPHDNAQNTPKTTEALKEAYYSVHCSYCRLELAALDMGDEIYYFFGCIASS